MDNQDRTSDLKNVKTAEKELIEASSSQYVLKLCQKNRISFSPTFWAKKLRYKYEKYYLKCVKYSFSESVINTIFEKEFDSAEPDIELLIILLYLGANPNYFSKMHSESLFHWSINNGHKNLTKLLISIGDIEIKNEYDLTPLHVAVMNADIKTVRNLLSAGSNVNSLSGSGKSPLHMASICPENNEISLLLLKNGAKLNVLDSEGKNALHYAIQNRNRNLIKLMINASHDRYVRHLERPLKTFREIYLQNTLDADRIKKRLIA